jgi:Tol biopolymer transport system component
MTLQAWAAVVVLALVTAAPAGAICTLDRATGTTIDRKPFLEHGYGTRWNLTTNTIAFMQPNANGYYRIYTMRPDGSGRRALNPPGLPPGHRGAVSWHPSGRYLLFVAHKAEWADRRMFGSPAYGALPGWGVHDDLWVAAADGSAAWRLTNDPNTRREGELLPIFSPDGRKVAWAQRQPDKSYVLNVADFSHAPSPHLTNIVSMRPGQGQYFEPGSFSSDGRYLVYTSDDGTHSFWASQIYALNLATGQAKRLTQGCAYNEHPVVVKTATGDWILYMSTKGAQREPWRLSLGTDWWAMRLDGSGAKRLTFMNANRPGNPENFGSPMVATTAAISPAGDFFLGDIQDSLVKQTGLVRVVRFACG